MNVKTVAHEASGPSSRFSHTLKVGQWYVADFAYDNDTACLFIDGIPISVHAFPAGKIELLHGISLFIGASSDDGLDCFLGSIAAIQWSNDLPAVQENLLDEQRSHPEWFLTHKYESLQKSFSLGPPQSAPIFETSTGAFLQSFKNGMLTYHEDVGSAFALSGQILSFYLSFSNRSDLGFLLSDEGNAPVPGGRMCTFSRGAIYSSDSTGSIPLIGQFYLDYLNLAAPECLGLPSQLPSQVEGGLEQLFQIGAIYKRNGTSVGHAVYGDIFGKFLSLGGLSRLGFPVADQYEILSKGRATGKVSEFEGGTIFWTPRLGAHVISGDLLRKYNAIGGPSSFLGFPIADEADIPEVAGPARIVCFENGSLLWYGSYESVIVARPFEIYLGVLDTEDVDTWPKGENDLFINVTLKQNRTDVLKKRYPNSGSWSNNNVHNIDKKLPFKFTPNSANLVVTLSIEVREEDPHNPDDFVGSYSHILTIADAWGLRHRGGIFDSGRKGKIRNLKWSVKPKVDPATLSETEKFWALQNRGTPEISTTQYATAFSNVNNEPDWWSATDWINKLIYKIAIKGAAKNGNCFGMSLEAIYARNDRSLMSLPIDRFLVWDDIVDAFNIKQCYQLGAGPVWWLISQFIYGQTHSPKNVFQLSQASAAYGFPPLLCFTQNYNFSGAPHCVLPVAWNRDSKPWTITICDPNYPGQLQQLTVDPDNNNFNYNAGNQYSGGAWSGGRLFFYPYFVLASRPRTLAWEAMALLVAGVFIIIGADGTTSSITDSNGKNLDATGSDALEDLQNGRAPEHYFVPIKGIASGHDGIMAGEIFARRSANDLDASPTTKLSAIRASGLPISSLPSGLHTQKLFQTVSPSLSRRSAHNLLNDQTSLRKLNPPLRKTIKDLAIAADAGTFHHAIRGLIAGGEFSYTVKSPLSAFNFTSAFEIDDLHSLIVSNLGTPRSSVILRSNRAKIFTAELVNSLGTHDIISVSLSGILVEQGRPVMLNLKPGLSTLEIITGQPSTIVATLSARISGSNIKKRFSIPSSQGFRMKLSQALHADTISVAEINTLFGPVVSSQGIRGKNSFS